MKLPNTRPDYQEEFSDWAIRYYDHNHQYFIFNDDEWNWVPSVTGVVKHLDPTAVGGISGWYAKVTRESIAATLGEYPKITKAALVSALDNAKGEPNRKASEAGDYGTDVHSLAEAVLRKAHDQHKNPGFALDQRDTGDAEPLVASHERLEQVRGQIEQWVDMYDPEPYALEQVMGNPYMGYAGTLDMLVSIGDELWIIDIKTSTSIRNEYWVQLHGYQQLLEQTEYTDYYGGSPTRRGILWLPRDPTKSCVFYDDPLSADEGRDAFYSCLATCHSYNSIKSKKPEVLARWK